MPFCSRGECLPDHLHRKLNLPRSSGGRVQQTCTPDRIPTSVKDLAVGCRRIEIGVIKNVENFHPELDVKLFRDSSHVVVLKERHVQVNQSRTHDAVASTIAQEICTGTGNARTGHAWSRKRCRYKTKRLTLRRDVRRGLRKTKAIKVQIIETAVNRITTQHN